MDVSDIFSFFSLGEGKGESGATARGGRSVFIENQKITGGGVSHEGWGARGPRGCLRGIWGGSKYFFSGRKCPPSLRLFDSLRLFSAIQGYFQNIHKTKSHKLS